MARKLHPTAAQYFVDLGKNIMTPDVVSYEFSGRFAVELSTGTGIRQNRIYGVTVIDAYTGERRKDLSECYQYLVDAQHAISELRFD